MKALVNKELIYETLMLRKNSTDEILSVLEQFVSELNSLTECNDLVCIENSKVVPVTVPLNTTIFPLVAFEVTHRVPGKCTIHLVAEDGTAAKCFSKVELEEFLIQLNRNPTFCWRLNKYIEMRVSIDMQDEDYL